MFPSLVSSAISMASSKDGTGDDMMMEDSANNNNNHMDMGMDNSNPEASVDISDDSMASGIASDEFPGMTSYYNDGQTIESMNMDNNPGDRQTQMMIIE